MKQEVSLPRPWHTPTNRLEEGSCPSGSSRALAPVLLLAILHALAPVTMAGDNLHLDCSPRTFQVVPGEPIRLQLTVQADSAVPFRWRVPNEPSLKLRAVEKTPVQRTPDGLVVYKRVIVWQGLEPGTVMLDTLSLETKEQKLPFPVVTITVRDPAP